MGSQALRRVSVVAGAIAVLVGMVWTGQGAGVLPGTFMVGSQTWLGIGLLCLAAGAFLVFIGLRRPQRYVAAGTPGHGGSGW